MTRRIVSGLLAATAGVAAAVAVPGSPTASATPTPGSYTITACSPGSSSGAWTSTDQATTSLTTSNLCGGVPAFGPDDAATQAISTTGALFAEDQIGSTTPVPTGSHAGWELNVPAGIQITAISYYSSYEASMDGWLSGLQVDGTPQSSDCQRNLLHTTPCAYYNNQAPQVETGLDASSVFFGVQCAQVEGGQTCLPSVGGSHDVEAALYSAQVTLQRTGGPIVQSEGGPLWGSGVVTGSVPLSFNASDPSGIADVQVLSDTGATLLNQQQSCTYTQVQACQELPSGQVQINTSALQDGAQNIQLVLTNAAGDTTVVQGPTIAIDNNGPPAPSQLTATAASATSDVIDLAWSNPANSPQPIAAAYLELCQATCASPVQVSTSGAAQVTAPAAGSYTVRLWLTDTAGQGGQSNIATTNVTVPAATSTQTTTTTTTTTTTPTATTTTTPTTTTTTMPTMPATTPVKVPTSASCRACPGKRHPRCAIRHCVRVRVRSATWSDGWLTVELARFPHGDRLAVRLYYRRAKPRTITVRVSHDVAKIKTRRPTRTVLVAVRDSHPVGAAKTIRPAA